ncbi:ComF family protein [Microbaculum marinum]|uniref:ComF family protein n=1 Tax=Microbaculum marinum TaxID=1764581 RepID=A0AAW9RS24_9HYPH
MAVTAREPDYRIPLANSRSVLDRTRDGARRLIDLVLPQRCAACGTPGTGHGLCGACWSGVDFIAAPVCQRLGTPFPYDPGEAVTSPAAIADPPDFGRARAVARYDGPARALVRSLKFQDRMELAGLMAGLMVRSGQELLETCDVVVPIPLHRRRLFGRRFNQAAALAGRIAGLAGCDYQPMAVQRVKSTRHQVGLSAAERRRNVAGAFRVAVEARPLVEGRRVVLVDDVLTTGATANACARACLRAGAAGVDVLVFARVAAPV